MNINDNFSSTLNLFNKTSFSSPAILEVQFKQQELYSARQLLGITARLWQDIVIREGWVGGKGAGESTPTDSRRDTSFLYAFLGDQGQEIKGHLFAISCRFGLGLLEIRTARPLQATTDLPFLLPSTNTYISIYKIFPPCPLTGHSVIFWVQRLMSELSSMVVHRFCLLSQPQYGSLAPRHSLHGQRQNIKAL